MITSKLRPKVLKEERQMHESFEGNNFLYKYEYKETSERVSSNQI